MALHSTPTTGAGSPGARFLSLALAAGLLAAGLAARAQAASPLVVEGSPGEMSLRSDATITVRFEKTPGALKWLVASTSEAPIPRALSEFVRNERGALVIEVPSASGPTLTWSEKGIEIRWASRGNPGDRFADSGPPAYPLGPGDKLQITVYAVEDMDKTVIVDPKGNITFPVLDKVSVLGMTVNDLQHEMERLLKAYVREPQISIQVLEYGSRFVNVLGEVGSPGRIPIKGALRLLDAVSQAGGFTEKSGDVEVQRRGTGGGLVTRNISREALLTGDKETHNIYVHDQDVVNVQPVKQVYVSGEVKSPGSFPYNKDMTLLRAVTKAGGFTQWARKSRVDILRTQPDGSTQTLHADASEIEKGDTQDLPLMPNDQVVVRERKLF